MNPEVRTAIVMIHMYCRAHHGRDKGLCKECTGLLTYAQERIAACPFGEGKPICSKCTVHCYSPEMRARIQTVMRYAGPRMVWHHPILAIRHLWRLRRRSR
jgi:hypothetical protein